jgi:hemerythrin-like domain-containing protein
LEGYVRNSLETTPDEAIRLLLDCHEQTRECLSLARHIADAKTPDGEEVLEAAWRVRRFFDRVLPLHARDEEDSILPRLRGRDPALDEELDWVIRDHHGHGRTIAALVAACEEIARIPSKRAALARYVARAAAELESHFLEHLTREEEIVFPAMRRLLDASACAAIVAEFHWRRRGAGPDIQLEPPWAEAYVA